MHNEEIIENLFEAARSETPVRELSHIREYMNTVDLTGTQSNLIINWLKQYKMNIILTVSAVVITATLALFPEQEAVENLETQQVVGIESVVTEVPPEPIANIKEPIEEVSTAKQQVEQKKSNQRKASEENVPERDNATPTGSTKHRDPVAKRSTTQSVKPASNVDQVDRSKTKVSEHQILLESKDGRASAEKFEAYLRANLSKLNPELTSSASSNLIRKFTLKLDNGLQANFQMQVTGFEKFELHWRTNANNEVQDMWYKLNAGESKELDFSKETKSSVKVKHKSSGF